MARFKRIEVVTRMQEIGIIPVFYNSDIEKAKNIVSACAQGGAYVVEMTNRGDGAVDVFKELERHCIQNFPNVMLGAGSVVDPYTAAQYINSGASFIVGPSLDRETAIICNKRKIPYSPGCGSVTEVQKAHELGVEIIKIFPGSQVGGPSFVKAVRGPMPWTSIMPTGGVSPTRESLGEWFAAGICCAGMGSKLIRKDLVEADDFAGITKLIHETISLTKEIKTMV